jgi:hypothetical protein
MKFLGMLTATQFNAVMGYAKSIHNTDDDVRGLMWCGGWARKAFVC